MVASDSLLFNGKVWAWGVEKSRSGKPRKVLTGDACLDIELHIRQTRLWLQNCGTVRVHWPSVSQLARRRSRSGATNSEHSNINPDARQDPKLTSHSNVT
jgi:hypothetical protein